MKRAPTSGWLALMAGAALLAGCGDPQHEPVKVIASARPAADPLATALPGTVNAAVPQVPAPRAVTAAPPMPAPLPASAPSTPASEVRRAGFIERAAAPPMVQPGEATGNDAFRQAIEARKARTS